MQRYKMIGSIIVAAVLALLLLSGPGTAAAWYSTSSAPGGQIVSDSIDLATPNGAGTVKTVDWSATTLQLTAPGAGSATYAGVSAPAAALKNLGTRELFVELAAVQFAAGAETSAAQAKALASAVKVSWSVIATGAACNATNFAAGASAQVLTAVATGEPGVPQIISSNGFAASRQLLAGAQKTLCAKYEIVDATLVPALAWGRVITVSYSWIGVDRATNSWTTAPVVWTQKVQLNVPAPIISCSVVNGVPTVAWAWPTAAGGADPTSFDVNIVGFLTNNTAAQAGSVRSIGITTGVVGSIFGANYTVKVTAKVGSQSSPASSTITVRFFTGGSGTC